MTRIDITIVAARRPELLDRTLTSFGPALFHRFCLGRVAINLDPIFGDATDHNACRRVLDRHLPGHVLFEPDTPSFGAAVKRLWTGVTGDLVFHLEDDWIALEPIGPERVLPLFEDPETAAVMPLVVQHRRPVNTPFNTQLQTMFWHGIPIARRRLAKFGTSPQFLRGDHARRVGAAMDPALDPEKQMFRNRNPDLAQVLAPWRCALLSGESVPYPIEDIGREWRDARQITKTVRRGRSIWSG